MSLNSLDFVGQASNVAWPMYPSKNPIAPSTVRYIKLGEERRWTTRSLERGEIAFEYPFVPHDLCAAGDWDAVSRLLSLVEVNGRKRGNPKDDLREIQAFYTLGPSCLWITFADDHMWWAFAEAEVAWHGADQEVGPVRTRKAIDGWHKTALTGEPLRMRSLNSRLTQVAAYRKTICEVEVPEYAVRRINGEEDPMMQRAREAQRMMRVAAAEMISNLHPADFETLVDLIFSRSGWQRVSRVGETQKDVDLILEQPATGEKAFVQVKSRAGQAILDEYIERFHRSSVFDRMFFVCHTPKGRLTVNDNAPVHLWAGDRLADTAVKAGLFDWLVEQSG